MKNKKIEAIIQKERPTREVEFRDHRFVFGEVANAFAFWEIMELINKTGVVEFKGLKIPTSLFAGMKLIEHTLIDPEITLDDLILIAQQDASLFFFLYTEALKSCAFEGIKGGFENVSDTLEAIS